MRRWQIWLGGVIGSHNEAPLAIFFKAYSEAMPLKIRF